MHYSYGVTPCKIIQTTIIVVNSQELKNREPPGRDRDRWGGGGGGGERERERGRERERE